MHYLFLHFLKDFSPTFAEEQYALAKRCLIRAMPGFAAVREFPEGVDGSADIDSGPLLFGMGPSASGFAVAAAATMDDREIATQLIAASVLTGLPEYSDGKLHYHTMPVVGQAVILYGKTLLLNPPPQSPDTGI